MARPNPFYANDRERDELVRLRDSFKFADPNELAKHVILIAGREGSGKTHLACTYSELGPLFLLDSELRAATVARKFQNVKFAPVKSFLEMVVAVKHILRYEDTGTIVIDSGTDMQTFAEIAYLDRTKMEKVYPIFNWGDVYAMCNSLLDEIRYSKRFNLILTARVKEVYLNEKATGEVVPKIYAAVPYRADCVLQFSDNKERKLTVTKNGFTGETSMLLAKGETLPAIIERLSKPAASAPSSTQLRKAV